jgi:hypothetical protein
MFEPFTHPIKMNDIPIPKDPKHLAFADFVLSGEKPSTAYREAGYNAKSAQSLATCAKRLLNNVEVATYLHAMRQAGAKAKVLTLQAKREYLYRLVTTPLMSIDPRGPDGDLIAKYKNTITENGGSEEIAKYDALKAIDLDNKLSGDDPDSNAVGSLAQALAGLAGGGAVEDRM